MRKAREFLNGVREDMTAVEEFLTTIETKKKEKEGPKRTGLSTFEWCLTMIIISQFIGWTVFFLTWLSMR